LRRYKPTRKPRRPARPFHALSVQPTLGQERMVEHREMYPSRTLSPPTAESSTARTKTEQSTCGSFTDSFTDSFTVAPAYNKGAYQVIPASDIQYIGK